MKYLSGCSMVHWSCYTGMSIFLLCFFTVALYAQQGPVEERITQLNATIDSLQMVQQSLKRLGQSIEEQEKQIVVLRLELDTLKARVVLHDSLTTGRTDGHNEHKNPFKIALPKNVFEWLITGAVIVAFFSFCILIIGVIRLVLVKKANKHKSAPKKTDTFEWDHSEVQKLKSAIPAGQKTPINDSDLDSLRTRMSHDIEHNQHSADVPANRTPPPQKQNKAGDNVVDINAVICKAAKSGLDSAEISKRYLISKDQVELILKVAQKRNESSE